MLTLAHINTVRAATQALTEEARTALAILPLPDLTATFVSIFEAAKFANAETLGKAFTVFYLVAARKSVLVGTPEHVALRTALCPVITKWHKDNPPTDTIDLLDSDRTPSWLAELDAATPIAQGLEFTEVGDDAKLACAIRNHFGLGGYEDLGDPSAIQASDPTMAIMIAVVRKKLPLVAPHWFDGKVLKAKVEDTRSTRTIKHEAEKALRAKKDAEKAAKRQQEREAEQALWATQRLNLITALVSAEGGLGLVTSEGERLVAEGFKAIAGTKIAVPPSFGPVIAFLSGTGLDAALLKARYERAAREAILMQIAELQPTWIATEENGDLRIRRSLTEPTAPQFTRKGGEILRALYGVIEKHGSDAVIAIINEHLEGTNDNVFASVSLAEVLGAVKFKPTPAGLWRKEKTEAAPAADANVAG